MKKDEHKEQARCSCFSVSRREFLTTVGIGGLAAAGLQFSETYSRAEEPDPSFTQNVRLRINGRDHTLLVEPRWSLLYVLREKLGYTGTKLGCGRGECGACTVLIDDEPRYACLTLAVEAEDKDIVTLEGLMDGEKLGPTQEAFLEQDAFQCGYCTPGQIMAVEGLVRKHADPDGNQIRTGVSGNLCRCGTYPHIFRAAKRAAELRRKG